MGRGERRYRTSKIVRSQIKILVQFGLLAHDVHPTFRAEFTPWAGITFTRSDVVMIGRSKKTKALDCGHTSCWLCHSRKYDGAGRHPTLQELKADLDYREQICEIVV